MKSTFTHNLYANPHHQPTRRNSLRTAGNPKPAQCEAIIEYGRAASENGLMVFMGGRVQAECIEGRLLLPEYQLFAFDGTVLDHIIE